MPGVSFLGWSADAGAGEVWAGVLEPTGTPCAVRLVRLPGDATRRRFAASGARPLIELHHPHLLPVLSVREIEDGLAVVTARVPDAISLRRLIDARGRLEPGEVVTIGLPVAQALTAAHAAGFVHGSLGSADILLEPNGRPQLAGVGIGALGIPPPGPPEPGLVAPVDVYDLADLLLDLMAQATGPDAAAVAVAVATALVPDLSRRPSAAELAANLAHSARPAPVQMIDPPRPPAAGRGTDAQETAVLRGLRRGPGRGSAGRGGPARLTNSPPPAEPGDGDSDVDEPPASDAGTVRYDDPPDLSGPAGEPGGDGTVLEGDVVAPGAELLSALPPDEQPALLGDIPDTRRRPGGRAARGGGGRPAGPEGLLLPGEQAGPRPGARPAGRGSGTNPPRQGSRGAQRGPRGWVLALTGAVGLTAVVVAVLLLNRSGSAGGHDVGTSVSAAPGPAGGRTATARPSSAVATSAGSGSAGAGSAGAVSAGPTAAGSVSARPPSAAGPARPTSASPDPGQAWRTVLGGLNATRSRAFEHDDETALGAVYQAGSALYVQDLQSLREVAGRGAHTSALTTHILELQIRQQGADQVVLRVTDELDAYDFLDANGNVLAHKDAEGPKRGDVTLVRVTDGWRISQRVPVT